MLLLFPFWACQEALVVKNSPAKVGDFRAQKIPGEWA